MILNIWEVKQSGFFIGEDPLKQYPHILLKAIFHFSKEQNIVIHIDNKFKLFIIL